LCPPIPASASGITTGRRPVIPEELGLAVGVNEYKEQFILFVLKPERRERRFRGPYVRDFDRSVGLGELADLAKTILAVELKLGNAPWRGKVGTHGIDLLVCVRNPNRLRIVSPDPQWYKITMA
jgi:hypothetical protein